mgnify:CR=1 FL=1
MIDIEKILDDFKEQLEDKKTMKEKVEWLKSYGFAVEVKDIENCKK